MLRPVSVEYLQLTEIWWIIYKVSRLTDAEEKCLCFSLKHLSQLGPYDKR